MIQTLASPAAVGIGELSARVGMSRQHLTRRVKRFVGIGPKRLARISRLRRLLELVDGGEPGGWAGAAVGAGYYDQPHMIAEVKALTGRTPERLRPHLSTG
ncbi:MAG: helix-turn-helix domain-containing protein [Thermoanaerobaculia bacterium]|nr:helix-turn-helix domain-containing protein [Thermoanaerobaculia bacterium]